MIVNDLYTRNTRYITVPSKILTDDSLTASDLKVILLLGLGQEGVTGEEIAELLGLSTRGTNTAISKLIRAGYLRSVRLRDGQHEAFTLDMNE